MHFNWELIKNMQFEKPFFLSGGIGENDWGGIEVLTKAKAGNSFFAIDINSKFEVSPGIKDLNKIKQFIDERI
jgi:phosphoribosylanthranilate isomerase